MSSPTEQLVEDAAAVYFGVIGAATKRGVKIDDAGERSDAPQITLKGRLTAALYRLNRSLPHDTIEEVVQILPNDLQKEADAVIGSLRDMHAPLMVESRKLATLRDNLLSKLLSGKVRVKESERTLGTSYEIGQ